VARVAGEYEATIMDSGASAGCSAVIGQAVADRGRRSELVGVATVANANVPDLDSNHTFFVLVHGDGSASDGSTVVNDLASAAAGDRRIVMLVADADLARSEEVLVAARRHWPIIPLAGSGELADAIANAATQADPWEGADARIAEIVDEGDVRVFASTGKVEELVRILKRCLDPPDPALECAWRLFAWTDANANSERSSFDRLQRWILTFGLLATILALLQAQIAAGWPAAVASVLPDGIKTLVLHPLVLPGLRLALVIVTVVTTVLLGIATRFKAGTRWVLLRAVAEAVKREIYRYRASVEPYTEPPSIDRLPRPQELVKQVNVIGEQLSAAEISELALRAYVGPIPPPMYGAEAEDSGFGAMSGDRYVVIRIGGQVNYYQGRSTELDRSLRRCQWATLALGGIATLLVFIDWQLWVPLTAALVAAIATYLEYKQVAPSLAKYNQAVTNLLSVQTWWAALTPDEKSNSVTMQKLVDITEQILAAEHTGWVRQMHDALDKLRAQQQPETSGGGQQAN
jgi:hypothetical protein